MRLLRLGLMALMMCLAPMVARAENHRGMLDDASGQLGVTLEAVPMNALPVFAKAEDRVIVLARSVADDAVIGPVMGFYKAQSAVCWGRVFPSAMVDENSPFHLCTHGTLAAVKAMADRLKVVMPQVPDVIRLAADLDQAMLLAGAAEMCTSAKPVDMRVIASPALGAVMSYYLRPSVELRVMGIALAAVGLFMALRMVRGRRRMA